MTGLEKIIDKIESESRDNCNKIISQAQARCEEIMNKAQSEASQRYSKTVSDAKKEADRKIAVSKSSAETITRTKYLEVRNAVINDIISASYEEIEKFDDERYFDLLYRLCLKNFETGECKMYLSHRDLMRIPSDFEDRINSEIYEKGAVQVSKKAIEIENGFILDYGDFEINCTLKAVFDDKIEELRDLLSKHLFA